MSGQSPAPPNRGYATLAAVYSGAVGATALALRNRSKRTGKPLHVPSGSDLLLLGVATFKVSRLLSRDSVTAFARAPFVEPQGSDSAAGEVKEEPTGGWMRKAIGELLTCPFCLDQWVATGALLTYMASPKLARAAASTMAIVSVADISQYGYRLIQKTDET